MLAPQFDSTFIKMLQEKGKARSATSGALTLINDYSDGTAGTTTSITPVTFDNAKYKISFTPSYEAIQKSGNDRTLSVASTSATKFQFWLQNPTICFGDKGDAAAFVRAGFNLSAVEAVDQTNTDGVAAIAYNYQDFVTYTNLAVGNEKLIATYTKDHQVKQNMGIPYLCDIPGLKYVFGSTSESTNHSRVFVTVSASSVVNGSNYSEWAARSSKRPPSRPPSELRQRKA
jgi:hypothetical protein